MRTLGLALALIPALAAAGTLTVEVSTPDDRGVVRCALFDSKDGWPDDMTKARATTGSAGSAITSKRARCVFPDLPAGTYGVSVMQDVNANDHLEKGSFGIPKEPLGFSNGAKIKLGPPSWKSARFALSGTDAGIRISAEPFRFR